MEVKSLAFKLLQDCKNCKVSRYWRIHAHFPILYFTKPHKCVSLRSSPWLPSPAQAVAGPLSTWQGYRGFNRISQASQECGEGSGGDKSFGIWSSENRQTNKTPRHGVTVLTNWAWSSLHYSVSAIFAPHKSIYWSKCDPINELKFSFEGVSTLWQCLCSHSSS